MVAENLANVKKHVRPPLRHMQKVLTCWPAAVLEASREKTSGTQDSKEQKRLSLQSFLIGEEWKMNLF